MTRVRKMATLSEHVIAIRAAIKAATDDGFQLSLEEGEYSDRAHVDLNQVHQDGSLFDWDSIIDGLN